MSGPQRKPTELAVLSGSTRAKARAKTQPSIGYAIPDPPFYMAPELQLFWDYACELLSNLRCICKADAAQLYVLAEALYDYDRALHEIEDDGGPTCTNPEKGTQYPHPAVNRKCSAYSRIKDSLDRFGLNPSSRSKVTELAPKLGEIVKAPEKKSRYAD